MILSFSHFYRTSINIRHNHILTGFELETQDKI